VVTDGPGRACTTSESPLEWRISTPSSTTPSNISLALLSLVSSAKILSRRKISSKMRASNSLRSSVMELFREQVGEEDAYICVGAKRAKNAEDKRRK
jgi:hypothetical protein